MPMTDAGRMLVIRREHLKMYNAEVDTEKLTAEQKEAKKKDSQFTRMVHYWEEMANHANPTG
jgi:hypothetical protein